MRIRRIFSALTLSTLISLVGLSTTGCGPDCFQYIQAVNNAEYNLIECIKENMSNPYFSCKDQQAVLDAAAATAREACKYENERSGNGISPETVDRYANLYLNYLRQKIQFIHDSWDEDQSSDAQSTDTPEEQ